VNLEPSFIGIGDQESINNEAIIEMIPPNPIEIALANGGEI
jgi:hypothetical protein